MKYLFSKKIGRICCPKNANRNQIAPENQLQKVGSRGSSSEVD